MFFFLKKLFKDSSDKSPEKIISTFNEEGIKWTGNKELEDDITFVVIKVK